MLDRLFFSNMYKLLLNFFYLLICALQQLFCSLKPRRKLKRCESGFLNLSLTENKLKVIIDLDNTLIFSSTIKIEKAKNYAIIDKKFYVYKRPHLDNFLTTISQYCDLYIYTAGTKEYAEKIIDYIDKNKLFKGKLYRNDCIFASNSWFKDVSKFGFDERRVLIIDDLPKNHLTCKNNVISIRSWAGQDEHDDSLFKIKNILQSYFYSGLPFEVWELVNSSINNDV